MRPLLAAVLSLALVTMFARFAAADAIPTVAARTAGLARHEGFVRWWWDARAGRLLLSPRPAGEAFLYAADLAHGAGSIDPTLDRGTLGDPQLAAFERVGPRVLLVQHQLAHRSSDTTAAALRGVAESFPDAVLASLPIVAESRETLVVDATDFLLRDRTALPTLKSSGEWHQDEARSAIRLEGSEAFPRNTELEAALTFTSEKPGAALAPVSPDGQSLTLVQHHSFVALPPDGYVSRAHDPRVGYLTVDFKDYAAPYSAPLDRSWIYRWRRSPGDRSPIVYYLDPAIPEPERHVARRAVAWWNDAFRAAGLGDAIEVRDLPPGASFMDVRYSGIQWTHRDQRAFSIGECQVDPRTGEILHAVVQLDSHRRRTTERMWRNLEPPARGAGACDAGDSPDVAALAAGGGPEIAESTLVLARLAYLVAHEVGHTLGLGHNMAATTFGWGSVMDYLGPHLVAKGDGLDASDAYPTSIGPYDRLAILWGYGDHDVAAGDAMLAEARAKGVVYPLESDARWNEYDYGPDPAAGLANARAVRGLLLSRFGDGQLRPGEPLYTLQERFSLAYLYHRFAILAAQHALGGEWLTNALAGDGQAARTPVDPAVQRRALEQLLACLAPSELDVPARIESRLPPPPDGTLPTRERFGAHGDAFDRASAAAALAGMVVEPLVTPARTEALLRAAPGAPTLAEVLARVQAATWGAPPEADTRLAAVQRAAQRVVLRALLSLAADDTAPADARALARASLVTLRASLVPAPRDAITGANDAVARAHVEMARAEIGAFLDRATPTAPPAAPTPPPGRPIGARP